MKNRYFLVGIILTISIFLLSIVTFNYYNYKLSLSGDTNVNEPSENNNNDNDDIMRRLHLGKNRKVAEIKRPVTFDEFDGLLKRDVDMMLVIGRTGCPYCEQYEPVLEKVSKENNVEIIYLNVAKVEMEDYMSIFESDITIPGKCVKEGVDKKFNEGFGTPLSLFLNKYQVYECIRGYKNESDLLKIMKKTGYVE